MEPGGHVDYLLDNVVAMPGALYRFWRQGETGGRLALVLIVVNAAGGCRWIGGIWVEVPPGPRRPGCGSRSPGAAGDGWLALTRLLAADGAGAYGNSDPVPAWFLVVAAAVVGCVGCDGRHWLRFELGGLSRSGLGGPAAQVAPAALALMFDPSVAGVVTFTILSLHEQGPVAPDWLTALCSA